MGPSNISADHGLGIVAVDLKRGECRRSAGRRDRPEASRPKVRHWKVGKETRLTTYYIPKKVCKYVCSVILLTRSTNRP